jgi:opacity protein-like surface antigen
MTNNIKNSFQYNNFRVRFCVIILGILSMVSIPTESMGQQFEITPFVGYRFGGDFEDSGTGVGLDIKNSESYGIILGMDMSPETQIEFLYSHQATELKPAGSFSPTSITDLDVDYYHFGGTYIWNPKRDLRPFIQATLGVTHFSPDQAGLSSETRFSFGIGGGVKYFITKHFGLRLDGRALGTLLNSNSAIFCSGGCTIRVQGSTLWQFEGGLGVIFAF